MFELIIFLILHDAVHSDDRRICCLSCETSAAHGWHVSIQSILLEKHRDAHARGPNGLPLNDSNASTVSGSSGEGAAKTQQGAQSSILGPEGFGFGKGLMLNENVSNRNRPMERLAERITMKYLKSTIQHSDPEYRAGVRVEQKIIPLSSDRCMLAPTHDSLTFATAQSSAARPQQQPQATSDDPQQQAAAALIKSGQDNQQWLFVVQRSHDLEGMGEIRVSNMLIVLHGNRSMKCLIVVASSCFYFSAGKNEGAVHPVPHQGAERAARPRQQCCPATLLSHADRRDLPVEAAERQGQEQVQVPARHAPQVGGHQ